MRDFILNLLEANEKVNYSVIFVIVGVYLAGLWIAAVVWVWRDATRRYDSWVTPLLVAVFVFFSFLPGFLIYLVIRPSDEEEKEYWEELERKFLEQEVDGFGVCHKCGAEVRPDFVMCPMCGTKVRKTCKQCGMLVEKGWVTCPYCGETIGEKKVITEPVPLKVSASHPGIDQSWTGEKEVYEESVGRELESVEQVKEQVVREEPKVKRTAKIKEASLAALRRIRSLARQITQIIPLTMRGTGKSVKEGTDEKEEMDVVDKELGEEKADVQKEKPQGQRKKRKKRKKKRK